MSGVRCSSWVTLEANRDRGNCNQRRLAGVLHVNGLSLKGGLGWGVNVPPIS